MTATTTRRSGKTGKGFGRVGTTPLPVMLVGVALGLSFVLVAPAPAQDDATANKVLPWRSSGAAVRPLGRVAPSTTDASATARLEQLRALARQRAESTAYVRDQLGPHGMSQKGLARRDARLRRLLRSGGLSEPEVLNVLLIRIAFEADRSGDLTSVTTDGNFQLQPAPEDSVVFDPPPHDKAYFEAHMRGLSSYWSSMSNGLITVQSRVLPDGEQDAVFLSDIADYGPGAGGFWTIEGLEKLVRDMILESDDQLSGQVNLADFDFDDPNTYIIFAHAGGDLQSNLVFTEGIEGYSPNDIPTFFVSLGDSARVQLTSTDTDSGTQGLITECSVIPETTNQDGLSGSIAAALMHEFGHALGLPDLYSTRTGLPTIGYWGIMDSGTNLGAAIGIDERDENGDPGEDGEIDRVEVVTGLLPPAASAWTRWYLGFSDEIRVGSRPRTVDLPASYRQDTRQKVLRLDVSPEEFFLVENRWIPPVAEGPWFLYSDPATGVVQYLGDYTGIGPGDSTPPPNTHLYDFFMPFAGGLQVWRVRQDRAEAFQFNNSVQADRERLGIELIEADGIQDIGVFDFNTRGFIGSDSDSFRDLSTFVYTVSVGEDSTTTETITYEATSTALMPEGRPNSRSTFRVPTGVALTGIGPSDRNAQRVTARIEGLLDPGTGDGWPVDIPDQPNGSAVPTLVAGEGTSVTTLELGGVPTLVVAGRVSDGTAPPVVFVYGFDGSPRYAQAAAASLDADPVGPLVVTDEATPRLASVARDGSVQIFADAGTALAEDFTASLSDSVDVGPVSVGTGSGAALVAGARADGRLEIVSFDSPATSTVAVGAALRSNLVVTEFDGASSVVCVVDGGLATWNDGDGVEITALEIPTTDGRLVAWPGTDGDARLVFAADDGQVVAFERDGLGVWSVRDFGRALDGPVFGELALGDVDGDGSLDLVAATEFTVWVRHASGADVLGFPKRLDDHYIVTDPFTDEFVGGPLVADVDRDGRNEVVFTTSYGLVHAIDSEGGDVADFPKRVAGGDVQAPLVVDVSFTGEAQRALVLFDALGDTLASGFRTFSARLTSVDLGPTPDAPSGEWLTRGGSVFRRGRAEDTPSVTAAPGVGAKTVLYPNPVSAASGADAFVRFFSGEPHEARMTLYNLEGQEVMDRRERIEVGGVPASMEFSTEGMQSGAYLCRLEFVGASGRATDVMTLYIER